MEQSLIQKIKEGLYLDGLDPKSYSPLSLAYIGDAIYEIVIRTIVMSAGNMSVNKYHKKSSSMVKASAQKEVFEKIEPFLTEEEMAVYKRGRNSKSGSVAKNASMMDYRKATGVEALVGYLYLAGDMDRIIELIGIGFDLNKKEELIAGRNAVIEALRAKKPIDKIFVLDGCQDGPIRTIVREAKKTDAILKFVDKERLNQLTNEHHQGVVAIVAAYEYGTIEDLFKRAEEKGEDPFFILLDGIEDPHNLGAIIRTANLAGAHGVIIPKHRAVGITPTVAKTSAGAINYTPVVKVTNIGKTMDELKERGMWFACADMDGEVIYRQNLTGSIGLVIGNEGSGVSRLVKEKCDFISSIPMKGDIDSLNASVAAGVLAFEVVRQRLGK